MAKYSGLIVSRIPIDGMESYMRGDFFCHFYSSDELSPYGYNEEARTLLKTLVSSGRPFAWWYASSVYPRGVEAYHGNDPSLVFGDFAELYTYVDIKPKY